MIGLLFYHKIEKETKVYHLGRRQLLSLLTRAAGGLVVVSLQATLKMCQSSLATFSCHYKAHGIPFQVSDWLDSMIGPSGLLLSVVSLTYLQSQFQFHGWGWRKVLVTKTWM